MINLYHTGRISSGISYKNNTMPGFGYSSVARNQDKFVFSNDFLKKRIAQKLKETADEFAHNNQNRNAICYYEQAIEKKPDYFPPYYNLAKVYEKSGQLDKAISTYSGLLKINPDEVEAQTLMGNCFKEKGDYETARQVYIKAAKTDPKYDFAQRSLKEINYLILARQNPQRAEALKQQTAEKALKEAVAKVREHISPDLTKNLDKLAIVFNETDSLSGHKNIAQYEHHNKKIVLTSDYIWAAPEITAAYIVHEAVHAKDRDGLSSIREEQDAYEESIRFWLAHNNGIKDPELDYAAELYKESPQKLRQKVGETYRKRDPSMPEYSPYHVPQGLGIAASIKLSALKLKNKVCNMIGLC